MTRYDAIVLGGGIIGAALAEELARRRQSVCLIERATVGAESSTAAAGILAAQMDIESPGPFLELCQEAKRIYPGWIRRLERVSGVQAGFHRDGILYVAMTAVEARHMAARIRWQRKLGLRAERWTRGEVMRREPNLHGPIHAGFVFADEAQVDNPLLMQALAAACRKAGVAVREQTTVRRLLITRGSVAGVRTDRGDVRAAVVINCLGSWAPAGSAPLPELPVVPAKGQILQFEAPRGFFKHAVMGERAYGVQRRDGRLIVGSTVEFVGYDKRVTAEAIQAILTGFAQMVHVSALQRCALRTFWAGLRPCSKDRMPILGPTGVRGLYLATGHFRHGILLAPITAQFLSDLILTDRSPFDLQPFSLQRFS